MKPVSRMTKVYKSKLDKLIYRPPKPILGDTKLLFGIFIGKNDLPVIEYDLTAAPGRPVPYRFDFALSAKQQEHLRRYTCKF